MQELSELTKKIVERMFRESQREEVEQFLLQECGDNLPLINNGVERAQMAVLKLSEGDIGKLLRAIELAQRDWRDVFMAAGFGHDAEEHLRWAGSYLLGNDG